MKELAVVLAISALVFKCAKPIALQFSTPQDFARRRNVWLALTATAFLSPNFWLFALIAAPLLAWAARKDPNPVALYLLLLQVIPQIPVDIPVVGINALFPLDNYRMLSFFVLLPSAVQLWRTNDEGRIRGLHAMDIALIGYCVVRIALFVPPDSLNHIVLQDSFTNVLRRIFLLFVDVYLLYFVVSRACSSRRAIAESLVSFFLAGAVMASLAFFEYTRHWLLYVNIAMRWGVDPTAGFYLFRGDTLRAQASAGHALALGYLIAIAFGFLLYIKSRIVSGPVRATFVLLLWLGLLAAYSRGPWIGALIIYFTFAALSPRPWATLFKATCLVMLVVGAISVTPLGDKIIDVLPFMGGSIDSGSVVYRQVLAERAWTIIKQNPFFGDQLAYMKMADLRQGQGIIDLVNTYAEIALFYGLVGLSFFLAFIMLGLVKAYRVVKAVREADTDLALIGASLVACITGTLLMIATCSFILGYEKLFYVLGGLASAFAHVAEPRTTAVETGAPVISTQK